MDDMKPPTESEFLEGVVETFVGLEDIFLSNSSLRLRTAKMQLLMDHCAGAIQLRLQDLENEQKDTKEN